MKRSQLNTFEKLVGQLHGVYDELSILSKKSPNDAVNKFKQKFLNTLLDAANELLGTQYRPFNDFECFEEEALPQNSDVIFILAQYLQCFEKFRADNVEQVLSSWYWVIDAEKGEAADQHGTVKVLTTRPRRLRE